MRGMFGEPFGDDREADIFGPEIVAPLRDAMRLIDGEQGDPGAAEHRQAARRDQTFRGDVEKVEFAGEQLPLDLVGFVPRQGGIQHRRLDARFQQARDLVAHQRDQGRDDDTAARAQQGWQLVTQRLAAAGRHQHQAIAAIGHVANDIFLCTAKTRQAEHRMQHGQCVRGLEHVWLIFRLTRGAGGNGHGAGLFLIRGSRISRETRRSPRRTRHSRENASFSMASRRFALIAPLYPCR